MKTKFSKRIISIVLSVLMITTMLPTFAISASAATTYKSTDAAVTALDSAISAYETKMNGTVYTNMSAAYTAYVNANKARDAYVYGDQNIDLSTYTSALTTATNNMTAWTAYTGTANSTMTSSKVFIDEDNATQPNFDSWYKNCLYVERGINANSKAAINKTGVASPDTGFTFDYKLFLPTTTFLYDGSTTPSVGVMFSCYGNTKPGTWGWGNMWLYAFYLSDSSQNALTDISFGSKWHGPDVRLNHSYVQASQSELSICGTRDTVNSYYNQGTRTEKYYSNLLYFNKTLSSSDDIMILYTPGASVRGGYDHKSCLAAGTNSAANYIGQSNRTVHVLNYKKVTTAIANNKSNLSKVSSYKQGGMATYLQGYDEATTDPNSFFTSSNDTASCETNYENAITDMTSTLTADNTNYGLLRTQMDSSRTVYDTDNACDLDSNNDKYTSDSWSTFTSAYDAAKTIMAAPLSGSYNNGTGASSATTTLKNAQNALTHQCHFNKVVTLENNQHQYACVIDGCGKTTDPVDCTWSTTGTVDKTTHKISYKCTVCDNVKTEDYMVQIGFIKDSTVTYHDFLHGTVAATVKSWAEANVGNSKAQDNGDGTHSAYVWAPADVDDPATYGETLSSTKEDHTYTWKTTKEATTEEEGSQTGTCSVCGATTTRSIPKITKQYTVTYVMADGTTSTEKVNEGDAPMSVPALTKAYINDDGHYTFAWNGDTTAAVTGDITFTEEATCVPHTYNEENWTVKSAATCTEDEVDINYCTVGDNCTYSKTKTVTGTAHGHLYDYEGSAWVSNGNRTHSKTCYYDSTHKLTETCVFEQTAYKAATCEDAGYRTYTCTGCGSTYTETINATGHSLTGTQIEDITNCEWDETQQKYVGTSCTTAGSYKEVVRCTNSNCTLTNNIYSSNTVEVPAKDHTITTRVIPACVNDAQLVTGCTTCDTQNTTVDLYDADNGIEASIIQPGVDYIKASGKNGSSSSHKVDTYTLKDINGNELSVSKMEVTFTINENNRDSKWAAYDGASGIYAKAKSNSANFTYNSNGSRSNQVAVFTTNKIIVDYYFADNSDQYYITSIKAWVTDYQAKGSHETGVVTYENKSYCTVDANGNATATSCLQDGSYDVVTTCPRCGEILSTEHKTVTKLDHDWKYTDNEDNGSGSFGTHKKQCTRCNSIDSTDTAHNLTSSTVDGVTTVSCKKCGFSQVLYKQTGKYTLTYGNMLEFSQYAIKTDENDSNTEDGSFFFDTTGGTITIVGNGDNHTTINPDGAYLIPVTSGNTYHVYALSDSNKAYLRVIGVKNGGSTEELYSASPSKSERDIDSLDYVFESDVVIPDDVEYVIVSVGTKSADGVTVYATITHLSFNDQSTYEYWLDQDSGVNIYSLLDSHTYINESNAGLFATSKIGTADFCGWFYDSACTQFIKSTDTLTSNVNLYSRSEHNWGEWTYNNNETTETRTCKDCGWSETRNCSFTSKVIAPTCTEQGYTLWTCSTCGGTYQTDFVDATGHNYGGWAHDENSTPSTHSRVCENDDTHIETVNCTFGDPVVTKKATCTEAGSQRYTCTVCGYYYDEEIPAIYPAGHDFATYTADESDKANGLLGTHTSKCTRCDVTDTKNHTLKLTTENGITTVTCETCDLNYVLHTQGTEFKITEGNIFDFDSFAAESGATTMSQTDGIASYNTVDDTCTIVGSYDNYTSMDPGDSTYKMTVTPGTTYHFVADASTIYATPYVFYVDESAENGWSVACHPDSNNDTHKIDATFTVPAGITQIYIRLATMSDIGTQVYTTYSNIAIYAEGTYKELATGLASGANVINSIKLDENNKVPCTADFCRYLDKDGNTITADATLTSNINVTEDAEHRIYEEYVDNNTKVKYTCADCGYNYEKYYGLSITSDNDVEGYDDLDAILTKSQKITISNTWGKTVEYTVTYDGDDSTKTTLTSTEKEIVLTPFESGSYKTVVVTARLTDDDAATEDTYTKSFTAKYFVPNSLLYHESFTDATIDGTTMTSTAGDATLATAGNARIVDGFSSAGLDSNGNSSDYRNHVLEVYGKSESAGLGTNSVTLNTNPLNSSSVNKYAAKTEGVTISFWRAYESDASALNSWEECLSFNTSTSDTTKPVETKYYYFEINGGGTSSYNEGNVGSNGYSYYDFIYAEHDPTLHDAGTLNTCWQNVTVTIDPNKGVTFYYNGEPHEVSVSTQKYGYEENNAHLAQAILAYITDDTTVMSYAAGDPYNSTDSDTYYDDVRIYTGVKTQVDINNMFTDSDTDANTERATLSLSEVQNSAGHDPTAVTVYTLANGKTVGQEYIDYYNIKANDTTQVTDITYYIFGTGMTIYKSSDNVHWTVVGDSEGRCGYQNQNLYGGVYTEKIATQLAYAALNDTDKNAGGGYLQWAPHIMYNINADCWQYYGSTSSWGKSDSCIFTGNSSNIEGPYENIRTVYASSSSTSSTTTLANAIDSCVYYGHNEDGTINPDKLYMLYGSWQPTYVIELDPTTGQYANFNESDPYGTNRGLGTAYSGKVICAANTESDGSGSGEGGYMIYQDGYYYLYVSLGSNYGNYNLRVFRSTEPDSGFEVYSGQKATDTSGNYHGMSLLSSYQLPAYDYVYTSIGHNSVYKVVNNAGKILTVDSVHARTFSSNSATNGLMSMEDNAMITRQSDLTGNISIQNMLAYTEDSWQVAFPLQYNGTDTTAFKATASDIAGDYYYNNLLTSASYSYAKTDTLRIAAIDDTHAVMYDISDQTTFYQVTLSYGTDYADDDITYITLIDNNDVKYQGVLGKQDDTYEFAFFNEDTNAYTWGYKYQSTDVTASVTFDTGSKYTHTIKTTDNLINKSVNCDMIVDGAVVEPTCTEQGYTPCVCTFCGQKDTFAYTDATGHHDYTLSKDGTTYTWTCAGEDDSWSLDVSTYLAELEKATDCVSDVKYTKASRDTLGTVITNNTVTFDNSTTKMSQDELDAKGSAIQTAINKLALMKYDVTVQYSTDEDGETSTTYKTITDVPYGTVENIDLSGIEDLADANVYKWILTDGGVDQNLQSTSKAFKYVAKSAVSNEASENLDIKITCYLTQKPSEGTSYAVTLLNSQNKVGDVSYVTCGEGETSKTVTVALSKEGVVTVDGGRGMIVDKPSFYNIESIKINGNTIKAGYSNDKIVISADTTISLGLTVGNTLEITPLNDDITINGNTGKYYAKCWNEKITLYSDNAAEWLINGVVVGYGTSYVFYSTSACEVSYNTESESPAPTSSISYFEYDSYKTKTVAAVSSFSLPTGWTATIGDTTKENNVYEAGIVLKTDRTTTLDKSYSGQDPYEGKTTLTQSDWWSNATTGKYAASSITSDSHQYVFSISRSATTSFIMGAVAYVKYTDTSGTSHTAYSATYDSTDSSKNVAPKLIAYKQ